METENALKYCLYARKSSEADERQALSIDSQLKEMKKLAEKEGIEIVETIQESKSAKESGRRDGYQQLLQGLRAFRFNAILTWAPDRLSRNAGDLGALVDLMDQGVLQQIRTSGQTFTNTPDEKFLLMILCSQAKLENDNRSKNVKRGMRAKCEMGVRPGKPPIGYKLVRGDGFQDPSKIIVDPERGSFIKKAFSYLVHEKLSGRQIWEYLADEGFQTETGKRVTLSTIYKILREPFYYGRFEYPRGSGIWYDGAYEPLISKDLFDKAQSCLKVVPKGKWGRKQFYFNRLFKCGNCGSGVGGETHINRHGKEYSYYKCNRYYGYDRCKEKYIREEKLIEEVASLIEQTKHQSIRLGRNLKHEVEKINRIQQQMYGERAKLLPIKEYIEDILRNGSGSEKAEILRNIKGQLCLKGGRVSLLEFTPLPNEPRS